MTVMYNKNKEYQILNMYTSSNYSKMSLTSVIINNGLKDICQNKNPYGVPRCLLELILQYRTYTNIEDTIKASYIPTGLFNYKNALKYAVKYNKQNIIDHFIKEGVSIL